MSRPLPPGEAKRRKRARDHADYVAHRADKLAYAAAWRATHRQQLIAYSATRYADQPETYRAYRLGLFGLTPETYAALLESQGGVCAACGRTESTVHHKTGTPNSMPIDHDHRCCDKRHACDKCRRGLLCHRCNRALGLLGDDPAVIEQLLAYRRRFAA